MLDSCGLKQAITTMRKRRIESSCLLDCRGEKFCKQNSKAGHTFKSPEQSLTVLCAILASHSFSSSAELFAVTKPFVCQPPVCASTVEPSRPSIWIGIECGNIRLDVQQLSAIENIKIGDVEHSALPSDQADR